MSDEVINNQIPMHQFLTDAKLLNEFLVSIGSRPESMIFAGRDSHVFHYTDLNALSSIVQKHDLWLTHSKYSNDDEESIHGRRVATEVLDSESKKGVDPKRDEFVQQVLDRIKNPQLEAVYVCCFCTKDDLLSQWRAYGANGTGVSVKFNVRLFDVVTGQDSPIDGLLRLWKVFYKVDLQKSIITDAIDFYYERSKYARPTAGTWVDQAVVAIEFFLPTFKNKSFEEESECRLIFSPKVDPTIKPQFRVGRGMLVPFYSLQDLVRGTPNPLTSLPIEGVLVGPSPNKNLNAASIKQLLNNCGYTSVTVNVSNTPYRV